MRIKEGCCFLTREETNSWNRVNNAPGSRYPDKTDHARVDHIIKECSEVGVVKLRNEDGVRLWKSEE